MPQFNLEDYDTVEDRLKKFWAEYPEGRLDTSIVHTYNNGGVIIKATFWANGGTEDPVTTGIAEEHPQKRHDYDVNENCWVENCETSAIGRALANWKYSGDKRPSREEMQKAQGGAEGNAQGTPASAPTESGASGSPSRSGSRRPTNFNGMLFYRAKEYAEANGLENPRGYSDKLAQERFNKKSSRDLTEQECRTLLDELKATGQREMATAVATVQAGFGTSEEPF